GTRHDHAAVARAGPFPSLARSSSWRKSREKVASQPAGSLHAMPAFRSIPSPPGNFGAVPMARPIRRRPQLPVPALQDAGLAASDATPGPPATKTFWEAGAIASRETLAADGAASERQPVVLNPRAIPSARSTALVFRASGRSSAAP